MKDVENIGTIKEATKIEQIHSYKLDLTKIDGSGDFLCPRCGTAISPDDNTEEKYSILDPKVNNQGLEELVIRCNTCASQIHLTGFSLLQKIPENNKEKHETRKKEKTCYVAHI